jgi:O-antigen ligase
MNIKQSFSRRNTLIPPTQRYGFNTLQAITILIGFSVPISVALDNLLLAILLLGMMFNVRAVWQIATQHPVARAAWILFIALFIAMFYGAAPLREAAGALGKYADLVFIPMFLLMLPKESDRRQARNAFLAAMGVTMLLSYLVALKLLPIQHWMTSYAQIDNPVIFHSHITQNNMMAFAIFLALLNLREAVSRSAQLFWFLFAGLATVNVLFMVQGRTGYLILLALLGWFCWATLARYTKNIGRAWGWRQTMALLLTISSLVLTAYSVSPRLHDRVGLLVTEYQAWQPNHGKDTSTGQRLDFYYNSLLIIHDQPLLGVGTGGFPAAFAEHTLGTDVLQTVNPHNEYLLITLQTGLGGLALLLYLFYTHWRCAPRLGTAFEQDAARGLLLMYLINCAFNSALYDHADGLFFAFMTAVLFVNYKSVKHG